MEVGQHEGLAAETHSEDVNVANKIIDEAEKSQVGSDDAIEGAEESLSEEIGSGREKETADREHEEKLSEMPAADSGETGRRKLKPQGSCPEDATKMPKKKSRHDEGHCDEDAGSDSGKMLTPQGTVTSMEMEEISTPSPPQANNCRRSERIASRQKSATLVGPSSSKMQVLSATRDKSTPEVAVPSNAAVDPTTTVAMGNKEAMTGRLEL